MTNDPNTRILKQAVNGVYGERIGKLYVEVHTSTQYATVYFLPNGATFDENAKPVATLSRKRVMDRSDAPMWSIATTDGVTRHADNTVIKCLRELAAHMRREECAATPEFEAFEEHMLTTALWSSNGTQEVDGEEVTFMLDEQYGIEDIADETRAKLRDDALRFYAANTASIHCEGAPLANDFEGTTGERQAAMAGHDFWLTRCGHGAGFWDGDWPKAIGDALSEMARQAGNVDLYVGDDNKIYI